MFLTFFCVGSFISQWDIHGFVRHFFVLNSAYESFVFPLIIQIKSIKMIKKNGTKKCVAERLGLMF